MENYWFWLWAGFGLVGAVIARRKPNKFLFDNPIKLTIYLVLNAFLLPIWTGPIYLIYVLIAPERQICPNCGRVIGVEETICPHCLKSIEPSLSQYKETLEWQNKQQEQNPELAKGNRKFMLLSLLLFFIVTPLLSIVWWFILSNISELRYLSFNNIEHKLIPGSEVWYVPAMFTGILTSYIPINWIVQRIFKNKVEEYINFQAQMYPGTSRKLEKNMMAGFTIPLVIAIILIMDTYTAAYSDRFTVNRFWGIGETVHPYSEIASIKSSTQLKEAKWDHPIYVIEFTDGSRWSSRWEMMDNNEPIDKIVKYVSSQSKISIEVVPVFSDEDIK